VHLGRTGVVRSRSKPPNLRSGYPRFWRCMKCITITAKPALLRSVQFSCWSTIDLVALVSQKGRGLGHGKILRVAWPSVLELTSTDRQSNPKIQSLQPPSNEHAARDRSSERHASSRSSDAAKKGLCGLSLIRRELCLHRSPRTVHL